MIYPLRQKLLTNTGTCLNSSPLKTTCMEPYIIIAIILLTAMWNGMVINWYNSHQQRWSRGWHATGFIIRALLTLLVYLITKDWYWTGVTAIISWIPYNIIINLYMHKPIFYLGKTSVIDKCLRKLFKIK